MSGLKIDAIRVWKEEFELSRPYSIAFRSTERVSNFFIEIQAEGFVGMGCAAPEVHVTGEDESICFESMKRLEDLKGAVIDSSILESIQRLTGNAPAARAGADIAIHDIWAQKAKQPLCDYLGRCHDEFPTSITIGIKNLEETRAEAKEYIDRGFRIIKLKLGEGLELDVERTLKLREWVGESVKIRVDMNQAYTIEQFRSYLSQTAKADIEFYEQPLSASEGHLGAELDSKNRAFHCIDESLLTPEDAKQLAQRNCAGIFNIKLMKCGGISPAREIAQIAEKAGVALMWGCMDESRISIAAALHTALSCKNTRYLDLDGSLDLARDIVTGGFHLEEGILRPTGEIGLGVTRN